MNEITKKWEKTGLLQELDDFNKNKCAFSLEEAAQLLIGEMKEYIKEIDKEYCKGGDGFFAGTVLPIVRRMYDNDVLQEKAPSVDIKWLILDYYEYCKNNRLLFNDLNSYIAMDGEAEFVCLYVEKLKKQPPFCC